MNIIFFIAIVVLLLLNGIKNNWSIRKLVKEIKQIRIENKKFNNRLHYLEIESWDNLLNDPYDDYFTPTIDKAIKDKRH